MKIKWSRNTSTDVKQIAWILDDSIQLIIYEPKNWGYEVKVAGAGEFSGNTGLGFYGTVEEAEKAVERLFKSLISRYIEEEWVHVVSK